MSGESIERFHTGDGTDLPHRDDGLPLRACVHFDFEDALFEAVSAFCTVGFSVGLTTEWNIPCKIVIMIAMFIGRIGVMTLAVTFAGRPKSQIKYPKENIVIG